jgi:hypothetical protein
MQARLRKHALLECAMCRRRWHRCWFDGQQGLQGFAAWILSFCACLQVMLEGVFGDWVVAGG